MVDINTGMPSDDDSEEVRRLGNQEKQRRFFEHYHTGAATTVGYPASPEPYQQQILKGLLLHASLSGSITGRLDSKPTTQRVTNYPIQAAAIANVNYEELESRLMTIHANQFSAAKRIDRTLRYGSKARKVDAKRALALNLSATSTLKLMKFMRQGRSSQFHAAWEM